MKYYIRPYKMSSTSSKLLAEKLECKRIKTINSKYKWKDGDVIINWGNSGHMEGHVLNLPICVEIASNKVYSFKEFKRAGVNCVEWSLDYVPEWHQEGFYCRTKLNGQSGDGCYFIGPDDEIPEGTCLYTRYFKHKEEYRVHIFRREVIDVQQKRKRSGHQDVDYKIRSHKNGWVYCRQNVRAPIEVLTEAFKAVEAIGLDFGAVDVGWNIEKKEAKVFEVNTAPGITGTTLEKYVEAFKDYMKDLYRG